MIHQSEKSHDSRSATDRSIHLNRIQRLYDNDPIVHWQRSEVEGLGRSPGSIYTVFSLGSQ